MKLNGVTALVLVLSSGHALKEGLRGAQKLDVAPQDHGRELAFAPISYEGWLFGSSHEGALACGGGIPTCTWCDYPNDGSYWDWYKVPLAAGTTYTFEVHRRDCELDTIAMLYPPGDLTDLNTYSYLAIADDNMWVSCGPFGDPRFSYTPSQTDTYSLAVASYASSGCPADGDYEYEIFVDPPLAFGRQIDVKPGEGTGCIHFNKESNGKKIPVAILSSEPGDLEGLDTESLALEFKTIHPRNAPNLSLPVNIKNNGKPHCATEDSNHDGMPDVVCHFDAANIDLTSVIEETATMSGMIEVDGEDVPFFGLPDPVCVLHQSFCHMVLPAEDLPYTGAVLTFEFENVPDVPEGHFIEFRTFVRGDLGASSWEYYNVFTEDWIYLGRNGGGPYYDCDFKYWEESFQVEASDINDWNDDGTVTIHLDASHYVNTFCTENSAYVELFIDGVDC